MDRRPIGVFDSGLGGLCAVDQIRKLLPDEKIVYFGDTGRLPYGTKSSETIKKYASQDVRFLLSHGVKAVLAACGTVSSVALSCLKENFDIPLYGVTDDAVKAAAEKTKNGRVAVIGTDATIASGVFERKLHANGIVTAGCACPLFVSLVECGIISKDDPILALACDRYLYAIKDFGADTLILGCTHFPIISGAISAYLPGVTLINPAKEAVNSLKRELAGKDMLSDGERSEEFYVSDEPQRFSSVAGIFLSGGVTACKKDIETY